jgi:2-polyprenyl-3-methyl-5-hydroxy-6-metoxy-1,4-benzoquinol methylase
MCGMVLAFPVSGKQLQDYSEYGDYLVRDDDSIRRQVDFEKRRRRDLFSKLDTSPILDFGSGAGYFCKAAEESGINCYGLEISHKLVDFCRTRVGFHRVFKSLDEIDIQFGSIFMLDVIEHLPPGHSRGILGRIVHMLLPGGKLIGNTPNFASANIRLCKDKDPAVAPPSHICYFTPTTLDRYLQSLGLTNEVVHAGIQFQQFFPQGEVSSFDTGTRPALGKTLPTPISCRLARDV